MVSFFHKGPKRGLQNPAHRHFIKKEDHLDPDFGKIISENIFDHKEDTLGIFLSPISGL